MQKFILLLAICLPLAAQTKINGSRVIEGTLNYCADAGSNDTYACNLNPAITAYTTGACYRFKANTANTGAATINFNAIGAKTIKKVAGGVTTDLSDNDIRAGQIVEACYDGTNMQMQSALGNAVSGSSFLLDTSRSSSSLTTLQVTGSANQGNCNLFYVPYPGSWTKVAFKVTTGSGTGCTGGTCGFVVGIYTFGSSRTLVASSEAGTSGNATSTKDINTTGVKQLSWSSGSSVSGGTLSLAAGAYVHCISTDSSALYIGMKNQPGYLITDNEMSTAVYGYNVHGYQSAMSTGNGGSIAMSSSLSGDMTRSGSGDAHVGLYLVP